MVRGFEGLFVGMGPYRALPQLRCTHGRGYTNYSFQGKPKGEQMSFNVSTECVNIYEEEH